MLRLVVRKPLFALLPPLVSIIAQAGWLLSVGSNQLLLNSLCQVQDQNQHFPAEFLKIHYLVNSQESTTRSVGI